MHWIETDIIISNSIHVDLANLENEIMYSYKEESVMGEREGGERGCTSSGFSIDMSIMCRRLSFLIPTTNRSEN